MSNLSVNEQQLKVLAWITGGSPEGVMSGRAYKNVAVALQNRGLVTITKSQGAWRAEITKRGEFYLANDRYPDPEASAVTNAKAPPSRTPPASRRTRAVAPTVELVRRVQELGEVRVEGWSEVAPDHQSHHSQNDPPVASSNSSAGAGIEGRGRARTCVGVLNLASQLPLRDRSRSLTSLSKLSYPPWW